jgi:hypothetical protein
MQREREGKGGGKAQRLTPQRKARNLQLENNTTHFPSPAAAAWRGSVSCVGCLCHPRHSPKALTGQRTCQALWRRTCQPNARGASVYQAANAGLPCSPICGVYTSSHVHRSQRHQAVVSSLHPTYTQVNGITISSCKVQAVWVPHACTPNQRHCFRTQQTQRRWGPAAGGGICKMGQTCMRCSCCRKRTAADQGERAAPPQSEAPHAPTGGQSSSRGRTCSNQS